MVLVTVMVSEAGHWAFGARFIPQVVGYFALIIGAISLFNFTFREEAPALTSDAEDDVSAQANVMKSLHMDLTNDDDHLEKSVIAKRAAAYLGWILVFFGSTAMIGMLPTMFVFVILYMRVEGNERWSLVLPCAVSMLIFGYVVFDYLLALPWPQSYLGDWFPILRDTIASM